MVGHCGILGVLLFLPLLLLLGVVRWGAPLVAGALVLLLQRRPEVGKVRRRPRRCHIPVLRRVVLLLRVVVVVVMVRRQWWRRVVLLRVVVVLRRRRLAVGLRVRVSRGRMQPAQ